MPRRAARPRRAREAGSASTDSAATPHAPARAQGVDRRDVRAGGDDHTCAAFAGGNVACWGGNRAGQLGLGILGSASQVQKNPVPQSVCTKSDCSAGLSGVTAVSTYDESACAVSNGAVKCWGTNSGGALGDGTTTTSQGFVAIVVDKANRNIRCWGGEFGSLCATGLPAGDRTTPVSPQW